MSRKRKVALVGVALCSVLFLAVGRNLTDLTSQVKNLLPFANGGWGANFVPDNCVVIGNGPNPPATVCGSLAGQALVWNASGPPSFQDVTDYVIASGSIALPTSPITASNCVTASASAANVVSTDTISWTPNASLATAKGFSPSAGGGLSIAAWPSAFHVNFDICNWSTGPITPDPVTLNWQVVR